MSDTDDLDAFIDAGTRLLGIDVRPEWREAIRLLRFPRQRAFNDALHVAQIEHPQPRGRVGETRSA